MSIQRSGIYYVSFTLPLTSSHERLIKTAIVINNDFTLGSTLQALTITKQAYENVSLSAAGFIKLSEFDTLSINLFASIPNNINNPLLWLKGVFSICRIESEGAIPAVIASMHQDVALEVNQTYELDKWRQTKYGQFQTTGGFKLARPFMQTVCDAVYLIAANIVLKTSSKRGHVVVSLLEDSGEEISKATGSIENNGYGTFNIYQIVRLRKGVKLRLKVKASENEFTVTQESTWSAALINMLSKYSSGMRTVLLSSQNISGSTAASIKHWPTTFHNNTEFKLLATLPLVDDSTYFSPPVLNTYLITAQVIILCSSLPASDLSVSITSTASSQIYPLVSHKIPENTPCNEVFTVSLTTSVDLKEKLEPVAITLQGNLTVPITLDSGTHFAISQLSSSYPGMLGRLKASEDKDNTAWTEINHYQTNGAKGSFDFQNMMNSTSGRYRVTSNGLYLVSSNLVTSGIDEGVEATISIDGTISVNNGMYTYDGQPTPTATVLVAGLVDLTIGKEISVQLKTSTDSDWKLYQTSGLSVAFIGRRTHCFRGAVQNSIPGKIGWTKLKNWNLLMKCGNGGPMDSATGTFTVPDNGFYYTTATILLEDADSNEQSSTFTAAVKINNSIAAGLVGIRSYEKLPIKSRRRKYTLFISGTFKALKGDLVTLEVESTKDGNFHIVDGSGWSLVMISSLNDKTLAGFTLKMRNQGLTTFGDSSLANQWFEVNGWSTSVTSSNIPIPGAFLTPSTILFENGGKINVLSTGLYLFSTNIEINYDTTDAPVFMLAIYINDERQDNGLAFRHNRRWIRFTLHFTGVMYLTTGQTVSLKLSSSSTFSAVTLTKSSGISIIKLPIGGQYPAMSLAIKVCKRRWLISTYTKSVTVFLGVNAQIR